MDASVVVDSNVFIGLLRRRLDPVEILGDWIGNGDLLTCGMIRVEVERGLRLPKVRSHLSAFFDVMLYGQTSNKVWEEAAQLAWELDRKGRVLPAQDILIAVIARSHNACVLTDDGHFAAIPNLKVLSPAEVLPGWY